MMMFQLGEINANGTVSGPTNTTTLWVLKVDVQENTRTTAFRVLKTEVQLKVEIKEQGKNMKKQMIQSEDANQHDLRGKSIDLGGHGLRNGKVS